jgi:hypothetical protein
MNAGAQDDWTAANQKYLTAALAVVKSNLERAAQTPAEADRSPEQDALLRQKFRQAAEAMAGKSPLDTVCHVFELSPFECNILLLCAGMELDSAFPSLCAAARNDPAKPFPSFGLALAVFPDGHWSALSPGAPLRYWQLVDSGSGSPVAQNPLCIDERVVHYLTGVNHQDERLSGILEPLHAPAMLAASHAGLAGQIVAVWSAAGGTGGLPVIILNGSDNAAKRSIALAACTTLGLAVSHMDSSSIPVAPAERETLIRLLQREAVFCSGALFLDCDRESVADPLRENSVTHLIERIRGPLIISVSGHRYRIDRPDVTFAVEKAAPQEQAGAWRSALGPCGEMPDGKLSEMVLQFDLGVPEIAAAGSEVQGLLAARGDTAPPDAGEICAMVRQICSRNVRSRLQDLAQRIEPAAGWDDIVLPGPQMLTLKEITMHVRQKEKVLSDWGFAEKGHRGLGTFALFSGTSGTGKTMAAEVLARDLGLDLFRIDLSQVVSKYIGETEKNLRRVFDAAEEGGVILLFDEADALFGKRSEVRDSHDRYANIEISYLLQRMEAYRGLAILTTNMKSALDPAFLRRIPFVVQFPFPDEQQRMEIWQKVFPGATPKRGIDYQKLARLTVPGGNIRNICLNAAFLAADAGGPVDMAHLLTAARSEYAKIEKPLPGYEIEGWV